MIKQLLVGLAATCLVLGACSDDDPKKDGCTTTADCADGEICDNGTCKTDVQSACSPACSGTTPICDEATGTCLTCTETEGCSGITPICNTATNTCVGCLDTEDCTSPSVCNTATNTCVGCTETEGCSEEAPVCVDGSCVVCTATAGCETGLVCDTSVTGGACVVCTADGTGCASGKICDTAGDDPVCVTCTADGKGCADGKVCDTSVEDGVCVTCTADKGCEKAGEFCDTDVSGGACIECKSDEHCAAPQFCDVPNKQCITCNSEKGCSDSGSTPLCYVSANGGDGACVACLSNDDCEDEDNAPICHPDKKECVLCASDDNCDDDLVCDTDVAGGACVVCTTTAGCEDDQVCDTEVDDGVCVTCTADGTGCETGELCDTDANDGLGACVECMDDSDCDENEGEICVSNICISRVARQINEVREANETATLDILVEGAVVTYLLPSFDDDIGGGFFVQAGPSGPAMLVMIEPEILDPKPAIGDKVSFRVISKLFINSATVVIGIDGDGWVVTTDSSFDVTSWIQDLGDATDVTSNLDAYEAELISIAGTIDGAFTSDDFGRVSAAFTTEKIPEPNGNLVLGLEASLNDELDLGDGCTFTLVAGPMWRSDDQAQPSAYNADDLDKITCPGPVLVSAAATAANKVVLTFDRKLDVDSVKEDGSQFTFDNELTVSGAEVDGKNVTLTTSTQTDGTIYTITVGNTVAGLYGAAAVSPTTPVKFAGYVYE